MKAYKLINEIIRLSNSNNQQEAKLEQVHIDTFREETKCICSKDIVQCYLIKNIHNNNEVIVGSECIKKFEGAIAIVDFIFKDIKKLEYNISSTLSEVSLDKFYMDCDTFESTSYYFYSDIIRKKKLTEKQLRQKQSINSKFLKFYNKTK